MTVTRVDIENAEDARSLYDLALILLESDRFADGVTEACRLIRIQASSRTGLEAAIINKFLTEVSCESGFDQFRDALKELRGE